MKKEEKKKDIYDAEIYARMIADTAMRALLREAAATPKPGLVDQSNTGAHKDMGIGTFLDSADALEPYFLQFAAFGIEHREDDPSGFLARIRPIGIEAEKAMYKVTHGINTHKGAIFSLGILCTACGYCGQPFDKDKVKEISALTAGPVMKDFENINKDNAVTTGEKLYAQYGIAGARGEAAAGFPTVFDTAVPVMKSLREKGYSLNDAGVITLVHILGDLIDTNVIHRSSYERAERIKEEMKELSVHLEEKDYISILQDLDRRFIEENISPGGSADLLALAYFICFMEEN